ncbi:MAG: DM13 domain-containing protein [Cyanophyceae cyanobacterium]
MISKSNSARSNDQLGGTGTPVLRQWTRRALALGAASVLAVGAIGNQARAAEAEILAASRNGAASETIKAAAKNRSGNFRRVDHPTTGSVSVVTNSGDPYLTLSGDFKTDSGPALEIILYTGSRVPRKVETAGGRYYRLAKLRKVRGSDRYALPKNLNLSQYNSVAIWCEEFDVTFGYAPLN